MPGLVRIQPVQNTTTVRPAAGKRASSHDELRDLQHLPPLPRWGGETLTIKSWSFEVALAADDGEAECGGHGHEHDGHCHCDPGYVTDPDDPLDCVAG